MRNMIESALELALEIHEGQVDREGKPFILHILNVALQGQNDAEIVTGLLHDVVEDSAGYLEVEDLIEEGYPQDVVEAVDALTRQEGEKYLDYVHRCIQNPLAAIVKYYDLNHNMHPNRQNFAGARSLYERHDKAREIVFRKVQSGLL